MVLRFYLIPPKVLILLNYIEKTWGKSQYKVTLVFPFHAPVIASYLFIHLAYVKIVSVDNPPFFDLVVYPFHATFVCLILSFELHQSNSVCQPLSTF